MKPKADGEHINLNSEASSLEYFSDNESVSRLTPNRQCKAPMPVLDFSLPPCKPLAKPGHSLESDMLFGWRPECLRKRGPIILKFPDDSLEVDPIFLGFRPEDSFELHEAFSGPNSYPFIVNSTARDSYKIIKKLKTSPNLRPFEGMNNYKNLTFFSKFESGNLDKVIQLTVEEFDLYIRPDTNSKGCNQWFYFSVTNHDTTREYKFNIVNFSKKDSLYMQGLSPCVYSMKAQEWTRSGVSVSYYQSKRNKFEYTLSFKYTLGEGDKVYFAQSIPYTYSDLLRFLGSIQDCPYLQRGTLCSTLSGLEVPMVAITDGNTKFVNKEHVIITGRVHPGETHSSFIVEGIIQFLIREAGAKLRKSYNFTIVPMLNPDGVIVGNNRSGLTGDDLNRMYRNPDTRLHPSVYSLKVFLKELRAPVLAYIDVHSHYSKKGSFFYGPHFPMHSPNYVRIRVIPKLFSQISQVFRYHSCSFRNEWDKRGTARLAISKEFSIPCCYTWESSCFGYLNTERTNVGFFRDNLLELGQSFCETLQYYNELVVEDRRIKREKLMERMKKRRKMNNFQGRLEKVIEEIKEERDGSDSESSESGSEPSQTLKLKTSRKTVNVLSKINCLSNVTFRKPIKRKIFSNRQTPIKTRISPIRYKFKRL